MIVGKHLLKRHTDQRTAVEMKTLSVYVDKI